MKKLFVGLVAVVLVGCVSDPLMTGKPEDWKGKRADDLLASWGKPTRVIQQANGSEIWEYSETGDFVAPARGKTSFKMGGGGGSAMFGARGGIDTVKHGERLSRYENLYRFQVNPTWRIRPEVELFS